jgi:hypothetical protein
MLIQQHLLPLGLEDQLKTQRRTVDFDTFDIHMQQLLSMLQQKQIWVSPAYQRKFRWSSERCSQFIESLMLGIPVPSLFMAANSDNTWEVVDGVQRLSTIIKFAGDEPLRTRHNLSDALSLTGLEKLNKFNGLTFAQLPETVKMHFWTRPMKVITLNDKSDPVVRYDLFERLNTGGVALSPQEIRDCVYRGQFADKLEAWSLQPDFKKVVLLTPLQQRDATAEECVLRFFAFRDRYRSFKHDVRAFLTKYMEDCSRSFNQQANDQVFSATFRELARVFPNGLTRPGGQNRTPLNLYEGVAVGASFALEHVPKLHTHGLSTWMASAKLRQYTTGATNDRSAVVGRIEFCRDRFMGKPYVPNTPA